jgi:hypothetical protein
MDDDEVMDKVHRAMREANAKAQRLGLDLETTLQFIADYLINHSDPDVAAFQEDHNKNRRRHLN